MSTILIAYLFTALIFGFFLYYFVWRNRYMTQIRLAIHKIEGRAVSIERIVRETKKNPGGSLPGSVGINEHRMESDLQRSQ